MFSFRWYSADIHPVFGRLNSLHRDQQGLSLVSVLVAFTILAVVVGPATYLIEQSTQLSVASRQQVTASDLAQSEIQVLNAEADQSFSNLTAMLGVSSHTDTVGSIIYTVTDDLYWTQGTSNPDGCNANGGTSQVLEPILSASVTVTWTSMAPFLPVRSTTGYHVPAGYSSPTTGSVLVVVTNQAAAPDSDIAVSLLAQGAPADSTQTAQTDTQGCAYFPFLAPGTYTVTLNAPSGQDWISPTADPTPSQNVSVTASANSQADFTYAQAATITIASPSISIPWQFGVSLGSTSLPGGETVYASGGTAPITNIFPASSGYQAWLGQCELYTSFSGVNLGPVVVAAPGGMATLNLLGQTVTVTVLSNGSPMVDATISIVQTSTSGSPLTSCTNPVTVVGTTDTSGQLTFLAPIGAITLQVTSGSSSVAYPSTGALATPGGGTLDVPIDLP
ncbi:prepilin-type N-terminal cleavage/methylation domain-containing protein [Ferrimicrobium sp.]|uniref:prepilin-type N-terminal cleavage/methylation domain-containing protein n=1 Tax=Ferrimicrobium sp. TaxID=2926050 RepID=UPI002625EB01|nr:prepilin-type N-terminal cleavage/methylation domain-containing protein [Ferrimicrobium sp.]